MRRIINAAAAQATVVMPGLEEGRLLTGRNHPAGIADFYLQLGAEQVVVKLGADGAQGWTSDGQAAYSRTFPVISVDTVGAGDGFAAGYIAALLRGACLQDRLDVGAAVGALVTTRYGDVDSMPTLEDVTDLLDLS